MAVRIYFVICRRERVYPAIARLLPGDGGLLPGSGPFAKRPRSNRGINPLATVFANRGLRRRAPLAACRLAAGLLLLAVLPLPAQQVENFPDLDLVDLGERADAAFESDPGEAIPYMKEIKGRLTGAMSEQYRTIYKENLFRLGLAHMKWYQRTGDPAHIEAGIPYWDEFLAEFMDDKRHPLAMLNRADSLYGARKWDAAVDAYLHVFNVYKQQIDGGETLGLLERLIAAARESERMGDVREVLWEYLRPAYAYEVRLASLNALMDRALDSTDLDDLLELVVEINRDRSFRYDLGINLRLLKAGNQFEDQERFLEAGLLFSMVLPVEELLGVVEDRLIELEERVFRGQYLASRESALLEQREKLRAQRRELADAPKYTANLRWRQARVLQQMGRAYEAYFGFRRLIDTYPQHEHVEQFHYAALLQGLDCGYDAAARELAEAYLSRPAFVLYEKPVATQLARLYQKNGDIEALARLADEFVHRFPDDSVSVQMVHSLGEARFRRGEVGPILETFPFWAEQFPDGAFMDSADYWTGMAHLFEGAFGEALAVFDRLVERNPGSVYYEEARFRRGVAHFGLGRYAKARAIFEEWLAAVGEHPLRPEAHVFLGDLDAMEAEVDAALDHYRKVESLGGARGLVDHAYFESAKLLEANRRYAEHNEWLQRYLERYPESDAAARAVAMLAETAMERGKVGEAFDHYREGIRRYGNRKGSDHVDALIDAWWEADTAIRKQREQTLAFTDRLLGDPAFRARMLYDRVAQIGYFREHPALPEALENALNVRAPLHGALAGRTPKDAGADGPVLDLEAYPELEAVRAQVNDRFAKLPDAPPGQVFREMRQGAVERGATTLALRLLRVLNLRAGVAVAPEDLGREEVEAASPATLVWIAGVERQNDPVEARMLLRKVLERGASADVTAEALFRLGDIEMEDAFFDQAAEYFRRVAEDHFGHPKSGRAALRRAGALRLARRYDEAVEAYSAILKQREWRGELWAEATFKLGLCFLDMDQPGKAQGFFERTYLAYGGFPEWAGKAVMESGALLERRGDAESARKTYEHFLESPGAEASPLYDVIEQKKKELTANALNS